jgi:hypothetical protein
VVEANAFFGKSIDIWGLIDSCPIATDGSGSMIIGHNEDDIGLLFHF